jgi:flagellar M-ring protein FliF
LNKFINQLISIYKNLSIKKKIILATAVVVGISLLVGTLYFVGSSNYALLMGNLSPDDSTQVIRILREKHIPFKVDLSGKNISIPSDNLYELRLEFATMGLPQSGVVGYEIFDKQTFGTTSFVQKLNQKRAQEGELMRTINTIKGVKRSRVHLAIPQKSAFVEDQKKATASVVLDLDVGIVLTEKQVYGIENLVARAVEGLELNDVVIMDSNGKVLSKNQIDSLSIASANQLDFQDKLQSDLERRVESVLSKVIGDGHVVAKITADLDFSQVNETQTIYDSDSAAVLSVEKRNDSMNGSRPGPNGATGNSSNTPGQVGSSTGEVKTETIKSNEVTNYKIPETIRRTTRSLGNIKRLSVAIVIDGKRNRIKDKDGKWITNVEAWSPEKIKEFEDIATSAVGLDKKRGDSLEIKNIEFTVEDFEEAQKIISEREKKNLIERLSSYAVIAVGLLLAFLFIFKPLLRAFSKDSSQDEKDNFLPKTIEELEKIQKDNKTSIVDDVVQIFPEIVDASKVEGELIKEKIMTLVDTNPHKAALILKDWLSREQKKRSLDNKTSENEEKNRGKQKVI